MTDEVVSTEDSVAPLTDTNTDEIKDLPVDQRSQAWLILRVSKFLLTTFILLITTMLVWFKIIDQGTYEQLVLWSFGIYMGVDVFHLFKK